MNLQSRRMETADMEACLVLMQGGHFYDLEAQQGLREFWGELLANDYGQTAVTEDLDRPEGRRVCAFGFSVFVTDEFADEAKHALPPPLGLQVMQRWRAGRSPILSAPQRRRLNADPGLNVVIPQNGWRIDPNAPEEGVAAYMKTNEAFLAFHRGYCFKECLVDIYGASEVSIASAAGFHVRTDYDPFLREIQERQEAAVLEPRPFLMGVSRTEALGSYAYAMFLYSHPRLGLSLGEQQMLECALSGATDEEIAQSLTLAVTTIKSRWKAVYSRVDECLPDLFPLKSIAKSDEPSSRAGEKRRHLLNYLRGHLEELRGG